MRSKDSKRGITWAALCKVALRLPEVELGTSYGTPALRARKKLLVRLKEDGRSVVVMIDVADRDVLLEIDPAAFHLTDHYRPYPAMLVRLSELRVDMLPRLLEDAWRRQAPRSVVAGHRLAPKRRKRRPVGRE